MNWKPPKSLNFWIYKFTNFHFLAKFPLINKKKKKADLDLDLVTINPQAFPPKSLFSHFFFHFPILSSLLLCFFATRIWLVYVIVDWTILTRVVWSLNNSQNSEINFCEKYQFDMLKINIISSSRCEGSMFKMEYSWTFPERFFISPHKNVFCFFKQTKYCLKISTTVLQINIHTYIHTFIHSYMNVKAAKVLQWLQARYMRRFYLPSK